LQGRKPAIALERTIMDRRCQTPDCMVTPAYSCLCKDVYLCANCLYPHLTNSTGLTHILKLHRFPKGANNQLEMLLKRLKCGDKYYDKLDHSVYTLPKVLSMSIEEIGQLCSYLGMTTKERCDLWNELQYIKVATGLQLLSPEDLRSVMSAREVNYAALEALLSVKGAADRSQTLLCGQNKEVEDLFDQIISETH